MTLDRLALSVTVAGDIMNSISSNKAFPLCIALGLVFPTTPEAWEWARFRGPNGTGISNAKGIPSKWTSQDYHWTVALKGQGHSSPVLWGERIFLSGTDEGKGQFIMECLYSPNGKSLWARNRPISTHRKHKYNSYASASAALDEKRVVFVMTQPGSVTVLAWSHKGEALWERQFETVLSNHGSGVSPMLYENKVILPCDTEGQSFLTALDAASGEEVWRTARTSIKSSFATPCLFTDQSGQNSLVFNSMAHGISSIDPSTGKVIWELKNLFDKRTVSSSLTADGLLFGTCGSGAGGNYLVAVHPGDPEKDQAPELAYTLRRSVPYVPTSVAKNGRLFLWSDSGIVTCVQSKSGKTVWQERVDGRYFGSPVWVEDRLFCIGTEGQVTVISASDKFKLLAVNHLGELSHSTPALTGNRIYFRTARKLICIKGQQE